MLAADGRHTHRLSEGVVPPSVSCCVTGSIAHHTQGDVVPDVAVVLLAHLVPTLVPCATPTVSGVATMATVSTSPHTNAVTVSTACAGGVVLCIYVVTSKTASRTARAQQIDTNS